MRLALQIPAAPDGPQAYAIEPGREVRIGRSAPSEIVLAWDPALSRQHFAVRIEGETGRLRDLGSSHGTLVNEEAIDEATLADGDQIVAGGTLLRVHIREADGASPPLEGRHALVVEFLRNQPEPLFAVVDAARDVAALGLLMKSGERFRSLYEGPRAQQHATIAPYLAALPRDSRLLEELVVAGWGKSWGIFLTSVAPFEEVRKHLRRFLTVGLEGKKPVLFRYYDPRVLRVYLPTCTQEERREFLGPISGYWMEADPPDSLLRGSTDEAAPIQRHGLNESASD